MRSELGNCLINNNTYYCIFSVNLLEFAKLLKKHGVVNAINLDGGGSSTFVVNGTLSNYPSDMW